MPFPRLTATRYVQPLREGGSLPAVVDTDDGLYVVKFRGAGQGAKALLAELVVGGLARAAGLAVPELALIEVLAPFGRTEPDPEIQDLLRASQGINVGLRYLDGAFNFSPAAAGDLIDPALAARIVWLDAFLINPDRTHRNPNLLLHDGTPWLIDHGAALYVHHDWRSVDETRARAPFPLIRDHVLLALSDDLAAADAAMTARLTSAVIGDVIAALPDELLADDRDAMTPDEVRQRYVAYLTTRLADARPFLTEAIEARERVRRQPPLRRQARR